MIKKILDKKNIEYNYYNIDEISLEDQKNKKQLAEEKGILSFPIIFKNNKVIDFKDIDNVL